MNGLILNITNNILKITNYKLTKYEYFPKSKFNKREKKKKRGKERKEEEKIKIKILNLSSSLVTVLQKPSIKKK